MLSRRTWYSTFATGALCLALAACGGGAADDASPKGGTTDDSAVEAVEEGFAFASSDYVGYWDLSSKIASDGTENTAEEVASLKEEENYVHFVTIDADGTMTWDSSGLIRKLTLDEADEDRAIFLWDDFAGDDATVSLANGQLVFKDDGNTWFFDRTTQEAHDERIAAVGWSNNLSETITSETYGFSISIPSGYVVDEEAQDTDKPYLYWSYPGVWVMVEVDEIDMTIEDWASLSELDDDYIVVDLGDDYIVLETIDDDGDVNLFKVIVRDGVNYVADTYYHPRNEDTVRDGMLAVLESFSV